MGFSYTHLAVNVCTKLPQWTTCTIFSTDNMKVATLQEKNKYPVLAGFNTDLVKLVSAMIVYLTFRWALTIIW